MPMHLLYSNARGTRRTTSALTGMGFTGASATQHLLAAGDAGKPYAAALERLKALHAELEAAEAEAVEAASTVREDLRAARIHDALLPKRKAALDELASLGASLKTAHAGVQPRLAELPAAPDHEALLLSQFVAKTGAARQQALAAVVGGTAPALRAALVRNAELAGLDARTVATLRGFAADSPSEGQYAAVQRLHGLAGDALQALGAQLTSLTTDTQE